MSKIRQILRLYTQGESKLKISEHAGIARNTLKKHIRRFVSLGLTMSDVEKMSDEHLDQLFAEPPIPTPAERYRTLKTLFPTIEKEVRKRGGTKLRAWNDYITKHPDGYRKSQFNVLFNKWRQRSHPGMHMEHKAGDKMYVDFAGGKLSHIDRETGEVIPAEVFVSLLGVSQLTYVECTDSQKQEDFIQCCENALHYFGGVPKAIVPDNLKSAVTKSSKYEPTVNETFEHFACHYNTAVLPTRAYKPKDKALVEGAVKIVYRRIHAELSGREFYSLQELNAAVWEAMEKHNNMLFSGRDYSRRQLFDELEKETLQPLPGTRFGFKYRQHCTVSANGHVCLREDTHYYSVPYQYIGKKVKMLYNKAGVEIFFKYSLIARHERNTKKYAYTTNKDHLASTHRYIAEWSPERFIRLASEVGPPVEEFVRRVLETKPHPEQGYKSCMGILGFERKVGKERLAAACSRALEYGSYSYGVIKSILERNLDRVPEPEPVQRELPEHANIRGEHYYQNF